MNISPGHVERSLTTVESRLRPILDSRASVVIAEAKSRLGQSKKEFAKRERQGRRERPVRPWGFSIPPTDPLKFINTEVDGLKLRVDLFLRSYWKDNPAERPSQLDVVIRVWCLDRDLYFRSEWDAQCLDERIDTNTGRVMLRFHFDLANPAQQGPKYHMQVGGNAQPDEYHWFPKALSVPRFLHTPVDLVLASEFIASTFYPTRYRDIRREPSWIGSMNDSQNHLLAGYFEEGHAAVCDGRSVLESLWNVAW